MTLPFWDETSEESLKNGIPWALTRLEIELDDGNIILNPLLSYKIPVALKDPLEKGFKYAKPINYETVRYPLSGLVGNDEDK